VKVLRWTVAVVILALSASLLVSGVVGRYVRTDLLNTDAFVAATAPLASDPAVQTLLADQVTSQITTHLNAQSLQRQVASVLRRLKLPPGAAAAIGPLAEYATSFIRPYVERFLQSPAFAQLWAGLIRLAHGDVVGILAGNRSPGATLNAVGDTVTIDVGPIVSDIKAVLVADGFTVVSAVPDVSTHLTVVRSTAVTKTQRYGRLFNRYANWLPLAGLLLLVAGLVLVPRRGIGTLIWLAILAVLLVGVLVAIPWGRREVATQLTASGLDHTAAVSTYDALVRTLVTAVRLALVVTGILGLALLATAIFGTRRKARLEV
jgi:hypothetical protein